jgi:hypothetical protein
VLVDLQRHIDGADSTMNETARQRCENGVISMFLSRSVLYSRPFWPCPVRNEIPESCTM